MNGNTVDTRLETVLTVPMTNTSDNSTEILTILEWHSDAQAWLTNAVQALAMAENALNRLPEAHERSEIPNAVQDTVTELDDMVEAVRRIQTWIGARYDGIAGGGR